MILSFQTMAKRRKEDENRKKTAHRYAFGAFHRFCRRMRQSGKTDAAALPEVRNNGTVIQWRYPAEEEWRDLVALTELRGAAGENGKDGTDGKNGVDGRNGTDGKDGINGIDGKNGINGTNGKDGINGVDGKDGINGIDGTMVRKLKSKRQICIFNGVTRAASGKTLWLSQIF